MRRTPRYPSSPRPAGRGRRARSSDAVEQRLDLALRASRMGTWWWDIGDDTITWDDAMRELFGVGPSDAVDNYEAFLTRVHPADRSVVNELVARAIRNDEDYDAAFRVILPDQSVRFVAARGAVYRHGDGKAARMVGVCWDASARRATEDALRTSEARYRGVVESQQDLVFRFNLQERVTFANDAYCAKFGLPREDVLGGTFTQLHPEDRDAVNAAIVALQAPPNRVMLEARILTPEGWRWISWSACAIVDEAGAIAEIQCVGRDVTERRAAEDAVHASNEQLRRSEERLRLLAQRLVAVREDERRRLGLDLHDGVCQDLVGIALLIGSLRQRDGLLTPEVAAQFDRVERYLHGVGEHLRGLARDLRPMLLHDLGLEGSIRSLVDGLSLETTAVHVQFPTAVPRLDEALEIGMYRIVQEASQPPMMIYNCHCTNCQTIGGGAFSTPMTVLEASFAFTKGEPRTYEWTSDAANRRFGWFCGACGCRIAHGQIPAAGFLSLRGGTLDDTSWIEPVGDIWTRSAQPWVVPSKERIQSEQQPRDYAPFIERFRAQGRFPN